MMTYALVKTLLYFLIKLLLIAINIPLAALNLSSAWLSIHIKILEFIRSNLNENLPSVTIVTYIKKLLKLYIDHRKSKNCSYNSLENSYSSALDPTRSNLREKLGFRVSFWTSIIYYFHAANTPEGSDSEESEETSQQAKSEMEEERTDSIGSSGNTASQHEQDSQPESAERGNKIIPENFETHQSEDKGPLKRKANESETCLIKRKKSDPSPQDLQLEAETSSCSEIYSGETFNSSEDIESESRIIDRELSRAGIKRGILCKPPEIERSNVGVLCKPDMFKKELYGEACSSALATDSQIMNTDGKVGDTTANKPQISEHAELEAISTNLTGSCVANIRDPEISCSTREVAKSQSSITSIATSAITDVGSLDSERNTKDSDLSLMKHLGDIDSPPTDLSMHEVVDFGDFKVIIDIDGTDIDTKNAESEVQVIRNWPGDVDFGNMPKSLDNSPHASSKQSDSPEEDSSPEVSIDENYMEVVDEEEKPKSVIPEGLSPEETVRRGIKFSELYKNNPKLRDVTDRLEFYAEAIKSINIEDLNDSNELKLWRERLTNPESESSTKSPKSSPNPNPKASPNLSKSSSAKISKNEDSEFQAFIKDNSENSVKRSKPKNVIASVSPIKRRNENYKPYPGTAPDLSKVKKDAKYQKKFYRQQKESSATQKGEEAGSSATRKGETTKSSQPTPTTESSSTQSEPIPESPSDKTSPKQFRIPLEPKLGEGSSLPSQPASNSTSDGTFLRPSRIAPAAGSSEDDRGLFKIPTVKWKDGGNSSGEEKFISIKDIIGGTIDKYYEEPSREERIDFSDRSRYTYRPNFKFPEDHVHKKTGSSKSPSPKKSTNPNLESPESLKARNSSVESIEPSMLQISDSSEGASNTRVDTEKSKMQISDSSNCPDYAAHNPQSDLQLEEGAKSSELDNQSPEICGQKKKDISVKHLLALREVKNQSLSKSDVIKNISIPLKYESDSDLELVGDNLEPSERRKRRLSSSSCNLSKQDVGVTKDARDDGKEMSKPAQTESSACLNPSNPADTQDLDESKTCPLIKKSDAVILTDLVSMHEKSDQNGQSSLDPKEKKLKTDHEDSESEILSKRGSLKKHGMEETDHKEHAHKIKRPYSTLKHDLQLEDKSLTPIKSGEEGFVTTSCADLKKRPKMEHEESSILGEKASECAAIDKIPNRTEKHCSIFGEKYLTAKPSEEGASELSLPSKAYTESLIDVKDKTDTPMECDETSELDGIQGKFEQELKSENEQDKNGSNSAATNSSCCSEALLDSKIRSINELDGNSAKKENKAKSDEQQPNKLTTQTSTLMEECKLNLAIPEDDQSSQDSVTPKQSSAGSLHNIDSEQETTENVSKDEPSDQEMLEADENQEVDQFIQSSESTQHKEET